MANSLGASIVIALLIVIPGGTASLRGATFIWNDPGTGTWNDPNKWTPLGPPGSSDEGRINNGGAALIDDTQSVSTGFAIVADNTGTTGTLNMTGGTLTTNFDIRLGNGGTGGGTGVFNQSGGAVFMNGGNLNVGFGNTAIGTYNLSGASSSMLVNAGFIMAVGNIGTGTVNQSGGTIYVRSATTPANSVIQLGRNNATTPASGTYTLSGGTAAALNFQFGRQVQTTISGTSTNVFNLQGSGTLITNGVSIQNTASNATNTFNFTGGKLVAKSIGLPLTNNGGILSPDFADFTGVPADFASIPINPVTTLSFTGANGYAQSAAGTLAIDIAGAGNNDLVDIGADPLVVASASLSGRISVNLLNGFNPGVGSTFDILTADLITNNAAVNSAPGGNSFVAAIVPGADGRQILRLTVIPEPASLTLLATTALAFSLSRSRRRNNSIRG